MTFIPKLLIVYILLFIADIILLIRSIKNKKWTAFIILTAIIIICTLILGYSLGVGIDLA